MERHACVPWAVWTARDKGTGLRKAAKTAGQGPLPAPPVHISSTQEVQFDSTQQHVFGAAQLNTNHGNGSTSTPQQAVTAALRHGAPGTTQSALPARQSAHSGATMSQLFLVTDYQN